MHLFGSDSSSPSLSSSPTQKVTGLISGDGTNILTYMFWTVSPQNVKPLSYVVERRYMEPLRTVGLAEDEEPNILASKSHSSPVRWSNCTTFNKLKLIQYRR